MSIRLQGRPASGVIEIPVNADELGFKLDNGSFVPYYAQIVDHIRSLVTKGRLREGQVFCSEGDISRVLSISKMPVRQAFQKLRSEGLLIIAKGKKPGGYLNVGVATPNSKDSRYNPELIDTIELGFKSTWFNKRLRANGKPHKLALVAVLRKLVTTLNAIIKSRQPFKIALT